MSRPKQRANVQQHLLVREVYECFTNAMCRHVSVRYQIGTSYRATCLRLEGLENDFAREVTVSSLICTTFVLRGNARKRPGRFPLMTGPFSGGTRGAGPPPPAGRLLVLLLLARATF